MAEAGRDGAWNGPALVLGIMLVVLGVWWFVGNSPTQEKEVQKVEVQTPLIEKVRMARMNYALEGDSESLKLILYAYQRNEYASSRSLSDQEILDRNEAYEIVLKTQAHAIELNRMEDLGLILKSFRPTDATEAFLMNEYDGSIAVLLKKKGILLGENSRPAESYAALTKWAMIEGELRDAAPYIQGLALHYGCTDLSDIWGGYARNPWHFIRGSNLDPVDSSLTNKQLVQARLAISAEGKLPEIPEACSYLRLPESQGA